MLDKLSALQMTAHCMHSSYQHFYLSAFDYLTFVNIICFTLGNSLASPLALMSLASKDGTIPVRYTKQAIHECVLLICTLLFLSTDTFSLIDRAILYLLFSKLSLCPHQPQPPGRKANDNQHSSNQEMTCKLNLPSWLSHAVPYGDDALSRLSFTGYLAFFIHVLH